MWYIHIKKNNKKTRSNNNNNNKSLIYAKNLYMYCYTTINTWVLELCWSLISHIGSSISFGPRKRLSSFLSTNTSTYRYDMYRYTKYTTIKHQSFSEPCCQVDEIYHRSGTCTLHVSYVHIWYMYRYTPVYTRYRTFSDCDLVRIGRLICLCPRPL